MLNNKKDLENSIPHILESIKDKIFKSEKLSYKDVQDIVEIVVGVSELDNTIKKIECKETPNDFQEFVSHISYNKSLHSLQYCQNKFIDFCDLQYYYTLQGRLMSYRVRPEDFFNYYLLHAIYHEMTHVMQDNVYSNKANCDSNMSIVMNKSINFFELPQNANVLQKLAWRTSIQKKARLYRDKYHALFPIEREADINGTNLSISAFDQLDIKWLENLKYNLTTLFLVNGYKDNKCPLEQVSKFIGFDYNQELINETQNWNNYYKMIYGLPVDRNLILEGNEIIGSKYNNTEEFVKKLTKFN